MYEQVEKPKESIRRSVANSVMKKKSRVKKDFGFVDKRSEADKQKYLQRMPHNHSFQRQQTIQMVNWWKTVGGGLVATEGALGIIGSSILGKTWGVVINSIKAARGVMTTIQGVYETGGNRANTINSVLNVIADFLRETEAVMLAFTTKSAVTLARALFKIMRGLLVFLQKVQNSVYDGRNLRKNKTTEFICHLMESILLIGESVNAESNLEEIFGVITGICKSVRTFMKPAKDIVALANN